LSGWESGKHWPKNETAVKAAKYLGLLPDDNRIIELEKKQAEIKSELERLK